MTSRPARNKIQCPFCACGQSTVITTVTHELKWMGKERTVVRRYRRCRYCKLQFTTVETTEVPGQTGIPDMALPPSPAPDSIAAVDPSPIPPPKKKSGPRSNPYV